MAFLFRLKLAVFQRLCGGYFSPPLTIIKEDNLEFWDDLRLTAFALIIELIDGIELSKIGEDKPDDDDDTRFANSITRDFDSRIYTYLDKSRLGTMMFPYVRDYYETGDCKLSSFEGIYSIEPIHDILDPFYSDAETVRNLLPKIRESMPQIESVEELIRKTKEYVVWSEICGEDATDGINEFRGCLHELLRKQVDRGETNFKPVFYKFILDECKQLCPIVESEIQFAQQYMIDHWIDQLLRNTFTENEYNIAQKLYDYCRSEPHSSFIKQRLNDLLCDKVFPIESKSNEQLYTCQSILKTLHYLDDKKLQDYYEKLMGREDLDPIAKNRCKVVMNHLTD